MSPIYCLICHKNPNAKYMHANLMLLIVLTELNLGVGCTNSIQCLDDNAQCIGSKCSCPSNFYDSDFDDGNTAGTCVLSKFVTCIAINSTYQYRK